MAGKEVGLATESVFSFANKIAVLLLAVNINLYFEN